MRGYPLAIPLPLRLYLFVECTRGVNAYAELAIQRGASSPIMPGYPSPFPQLPAHIFGSRFYFCISWFHRPTLIALYSLAVMPSHSPSAVSTDPSSLRAAALYQPPSNSQIPVDGNQSNADAPNFSRIISKVGPPVGPTLHEIAQPPKTDDVDQLPKMDDHPTHQPPQTDDRLSTEAASLPSTEEKGWVRYVHPEGWIYFFKEHDNQPEDIRLHEICGDLEGEFMANPALNSQATNETSHKPERPSDVEGEGPPVAPGYGGLYVQIFVDDQRWYASIDKALLFPQQLTDEEGRITLCGWPSTIS